MESTGNQFALLSLKAIGILPLEVNSLEDISSDTLLSLLRKIRPNPENSACNCHWPNEISAQYRICSTIDSKIKKLGYGGDVRYALVYRTPTEIRRLIHWLLEQLPKTSLEEKYTSPPTPYCFFQLRVKESLHNWGHSEFDAVRVPMLRHMNSTSIPCKVSNKTTIKTMQPSDRNLRLKTMKAGQGNNVNLATHDNNVSYESASKDKMLTTEQIQWINKELKSVRDEGEIATKSTRRYTIQRKQIGALIEKLKFDTEDLNEMTRKKVSLSQPMAECTETLQSSNPAANETLACKKNPYLKKISESKKARLIRKEKESAFNYKLIKLREGVKKLAREIKNYEEIYGHINGQLGNQVEHHLRASYTSRIENLCIQLGKQKNEALKVMSDTTKLRKDLNLVTGKLVRSEGVAEEKLLRAAEMGENNSHNSSIPLKLCYENLALLKSVFDRLMELARDKGTAEGDLSDFRNKSSQLSKSLCTMNTNKIILDAELLENENKANKNALHVAGKYSKV